MSFVSNLLREPVLPAELVAALFDRAVAGQDAALVDDILARPDVPAEVLDRFAAMPAWHTPARIRKILTHPCVPASVVEVALAHLEDGPGALGLEWRAGALTAPQALAVVRACEAQVRTIGPGVLRSAAPALVARLGPELAVDLARGTDDRWVVAALWRFDLPADVLVEALVRVLPAGGPVTQAVISSRPELVGAPLAELVEKVAVHAGDAGAKWLRRPGWVATLQPGGGASHLSWDERPADLTFRGPEPLGDVAYLRMLAAGDDPVQLRVAADGLVRAMAANGTAELGLVGTVRDLLANPSTPPDSAELVVRDVIKTFRSAPELVDHLDVCTWCPTLASEWATFQPVATIERHGWSPFGGHGVAPVLVPQLMSEEGVGANTRASVERRLTAIVKAGVDEATVAAVPARHATSLALYPAARAPLARVLAGTLTSARAWGAFDRLVGDFTGSIGQLLEVCADLDR